MSIEIAVTQMKILLADDEQSFAQTLNWILVRLGHEVTVVHNGLAAHHDISIASPAYDVVITDLAMPKMGGLELVRVLASEGIRTPVIVISGFLEEFERRVLEAAGVIRILNKPFGREALMDALHACFQPERKGFENAPPSRFKECDRDFFL